MLENFEEGLRKDSTVIANFMSLFKAFDNLNHVLLIANTEALVFMLIISPTYIAI